MSDVDLDQYRLVLRKKYDRDFRELRKAIRPLLAARKGASFAEEVEKAAVAEYEGVLLRIPYIGGDSNRLTWNLATSAMALAFYRAMKARDVPVQEIGELTYRAMEAWYGMLPKILLKFAGLMKTGQGARKKIRQAAERSKAREYPGDWVYDYIEGGPSVDFDFGVNYTECAVVKFFKAEGAAEFVRYLCLFDFVSSGCMALGMTRTSTLAEGCAVCDFRFKRGRKTEPGWPPGFLKN